MPDPTVPPTPAVPLSALLAREDLALRLIAGPSDPSLVIHAAHTSEMADPYPYLLGCLALATGATQVTLLLSLALALALRYLEVARRARPR